MPRFCAFSCKCFDFGNSHSHSDEKIDETTKFIGVEIGDNYNGPGLSKQQINSKSLEGGGDEMHPRDSISEQKVTFVSEQKPNASQAQTYNIDKLCTSGNGPAMQNYFGPVGTVNHVVDQGDKPLPQNKSVLDQKWWPEQKHLIKSFYDRKFDGQLIIEKLHSKLQESKTTVITQEAIVVSGLGGIGKTSIAKSFANHYESDYQHIIWIDCGEGSLSKCFQSLSRDLDLKNRLELNLAELAQKSFKRLKDLKCLIIYDNAECYVGNEGIRDVLPKCEGNNNLHSIITSRNQEWGSSTGYGKINTFCIGVFSAQESLQFMKKSLEDKSKINDSQIARLCELLGHLPLALQIVVASLNNLGITITEYIEQIVSDNDELLNKTLDDYERTINKTMKISLDQIKNDENGKHAYSILMTFGYIQPDDITLSFLERVEGIISVMSISTIWKAIVLLEKFSLVSVANKTKITQKEMVCVSIHRLLQQVIRHNGRETEKEKLKQILSSFGDINYKLIPYTFAEKYEDLKQEFTHIRAQLIDQIQLKDLLEERRFVEAANLALIIHESFGERLSHKEYLISMYNHAVCLEKSGQINKSVDILRSLDDKLNSVAEDSWAWTGLDRSYWMVDENNEFRFHLKELSGTFPNRLIIQIYIASSQKSEDEFLRCHPLWESQFKHISKVQKCDQLLIMLLLGLAISDKKGSLLIREEFVDLIGNYKCKNNSVDFFTWLDFSSKLSKIAINLISRNAKDISCNLMALTKLFFVSRKFIFGIELEELQTNFSGCKLICDDLHTLTRSKVNTNEDVQSFQNIISDLLVIIETESGAANGWNMPRVNTEVEYGCEPTLDSGNGKFCYKSNAFEVFFASIPHPELLTSLTLDGMTVYMPNLLSSITQCFNLVKIVLKEVQLWGVCVYKISLSNLKHFELSAVHKDSKEILDSNVIDFCTFFGGKDSCSWKSVKNLNVFHIGYKSESERFIKFDKNSETLTLHRVSINRCHYQLNNFRKLYINECTFLINSSDNEGGCGFCVYNLDKPPLDVSDSYYGTCLRNGEWQVDTNNNQYLFNNEEMIINESSFLGIKSNEGFSINGFLMMFSNLKYLKIDYCAFHVVDLFGLDYIEIIEIRRTKLHCSSISTPKRTVMNSQFSKRCKKLTFYGITPVDDKGNKVETIDFSSVNADELKWHNPIHGERCFVMINKIPSGIKKLHLEGVELQGGEPNLISKHPNSKDNIASSLHTIVMTSWSYELSLDLDILSYPLKEMKLIGVNLTGQFSSHNPFHLNKIILDMLKVEDFLKDELVLLLHRVDNVIITVRRGVNLEKALTSFPCNVKSVYACIENIDYSKSEYVSYTKLDDSRSWTFKDTITKNKISQETFHSKANI